MIFCKHFTSQSRAGIWSHSRCAGPASAPTVYFRQGATEQGMLRGIWRFLTVRTSTCVAGERKVSGDGRFRAEPEFNAARQFATSRNSCCAEVRLPGLSPPGFRGPVDLPEIQILPFRRRRFRFSVVHAHMEKRIKLSEGGKGRTSCPAKQGDGDLWAVRLKVFWIADYSDRDLVYSESVLFFFGVWGVFYCSLFLLCEDRHGAADCFFCKAGC